MAIRLRVAVVSAFFLFVQLLAAQRAPEPKAVQPDGQRHIEKVISCLPAAVVVKDDPHSCTTLAGSIEWAQGFGVRNEAGASVNADTPVLAAALQAAEKPCFVSGHDLSRAAKD